MLKRSLPVLLPAVVLAASAAAAVNVYGDDQPTTNPSPESTTTTTDPTRVVDPERASIDPRQYYDNYEENLMDAMPSASPSGDTATGRVQSEAEGTPSAVPAPPTTGPGPIDEPDFDEDNTFVDAGDSTFVAVDDDRESTFGLDVDTGSYTIGRRFLDEGMRPEPDSIRPEEWVNAFDYGDRYEGADALGLTVETAQAPLTDDGTHMVRVAVVAPHVRDSERPAAHLTFVVDTSGSMDIRERLGLVQSSLALLVQNLRDDDTISIVTYGDEASALLPPTPVEEADEILDAIDQLVPSGSTNMEAGLMLGYEQAREEYIDGDINAVILASDGVANVGTTDTTQLVDQIVDAGQDGINLVTVGYGMGNYNDDQMEQLANQGDGFYSYVDTYEEAVRLFVTDLSSTLTPVAREAKSQVVFDDEVVLEYRLIGYKNRRLDDSEFRDDSVDAGEIGAGHHVTALYEVRLVDGADPGADLGEVRLRWLPIDGDAAVEISTPIPAGDGEASDAMRLSAAVAYTAELLKDNSVVDERGLTLADVREEADELDEAGVEGADDLADVIVLAENAQG